MLSVQSREEPGLRWGHVLLSLTLIHGLFDRQGLKGQSLNPKQETGKAHTAMQILQVNCNRSQKQMRHTVSDKLTLEEGRRQTV
jgi:hypothetical protein